VSRKNRLDDDARPVDLTDPFARTAPSGKPMMARAPSKRRATAAPVGRRETRVADLGPRAYTAGGRPPASDLGGVAPVRVTAYLRPDQVTTLRVEIGRRLLAGERADQSALLREAIDQLFPPAKK
jgi:hypothetical protein